MSNPDWIARWSHVRRLLCVRLDSLGDVIMTTPALAAAKSGLGSCGRLTLLTTPLGAALADLLHEVDESIVCEGAWANGTASRADAAADRGLIERLRSHCFDAAIIFTEFGHDPLPVAQLCHLAGVPLRMAYGRENPDRLLTHRVPEPEPDQLLRHEVRRQLDLAAEVGWHIANERLRVRPHPAAMVRMQKILQCEDIGHRPWILVNPGAGTPSRRYPEELFAQVAARLTLDLGLRLVFTGSAGDIDLIERIRAASDEPGLSLAGRLSLADLAALINLAPLVLTNNAGPAHLAAALYTPVVVVYALTNPQQTPWHSPHRVVFHDVPCRYCYSRVCPTGDHRCLRDIEPDEVVAAVDDLLSVSSWPISDRLPAGDVGEIRLNSLHDVHGLTIASRRGADA